MAIYPSGTPTNADLYIALDNFSTTLSTLIDNVQTTIPLASVVGLPTVGILTIDSEKIKYTGISGNDITGCTRGFSATSAASHALGASVMFNVVEEHHNVLKDEVIAVETDLRAVQAALNDVDTPASTSSDVKDRLDQIVSEIKRITGNPNWYDTVGKNLTELLPLSGGTMTGSIAMSGTQKLTGLAAGVSNGDSLRYEQLVGQYLLLSGGTLTGALLLPDGSVSTPSLAFSNDSDTGLYRDTSNRVNISLGGDLALLVDRTATNIYAANSGTPLLRVQVDDSGINFSNGAGIVGTTAGSNAGVGNVGEYIESNVAAFNTFTTAQYATITSISLSAGDWDISAMAYIGGGGGGAVFTSNVSIGIAVSEYTNNTTTDHIGGYNVFATMAPSGGSNHAGGHISVRKSLSSAKTIYLKMVSTFTVAAPYAYGTISARRVR